MHTVSSPRPTSPHSIQPTNPFLSIPCKPTSLATHLFFMHAWPSFIPISLSTRFHSSHIHYLHLSYSPMPFFLIHPNSSLTHAHGGYTSMSPTHSTTKSSLLTQTPFHFFFMCVQPVCMLVLNLDIFDAWWLHTEGCIMVETSRLLRYKLRLR